MITKQTISDCIKRYEINRGWGRFFFGNTKGITQLKKLYSKLPEGGLSAPNLRKLYNTLYNRRERLRNRHDDYSTNVREVKLNNKIYRDLEDQVILDYEKRMLVKDAELKDIIPSVNTPFEDLVLFETIDEDTNQITDWHALDLGAYLLRVTSWQGIRNPYTNAPLSENTFNTISNHSTWGRTVPAIKSFTD